MHQVEDVELVRRACQGDVDAFDALVTRHHRTLYRTALAIVRSSADAEDVTQTAWLRAYCSLRHFRGSSSLSTWLTAIVRHQAIDHKRAARRRFLREMSHPSIELFERAWVSGSPSPEDLVLLNERQATVARSMKALPGPFRRALRLWHEGRFSYHEMAEQSGVPIGTFKSRVWEARRRLRSSIVGSCA